MIRNHYRKIRSQGLLEQGIKVICGGHPIELLDEGFELIVKNPGIPYQIR